MEHKGVENWKGVTRLKARRVAKRLGHKQARTTDKKEVAMQLRVLI